MSFIISIIRNIIPKEIPTYLGRWKIDYCKVKINNTIKLANEDHCGSCNQYSTDKINSIKTHKIIKRILPKNLS
jgi:hypothetical protein